MRGTLVFVHGTGVRQEGWVPTWHRVQEHGRAHGLNEVTFIGCPWGPKLGMPLERVDATLPPEAIAKALTDAPPDPRDLAAAAWDLLLTDPLFELRLAGEGAPAAAGVVVGALPADQEALERLEDLARRTPIERPASEITAEEIAGAVRAVAASAELQAAARTLGTPDHPDLVKAAARAVVARILAGHRGGAPGTGPAELYDLARRDRLVAALIAALSPGGAKGFKDTLQERGLGYILSRATQIGRDRRRGLQGVATPPIGDILYYQRRGGVMLDYIVEQMRNAIPPVVAVGHSLGGIMLVDLLSRPDAPRVDLLVTAGSQAPMLYALDALEQVRWGQARPAPFTPWINFYNPRDFLSFCAARIFPDVTGIRDIEIDPGVPFPESHSAYWVHDPVYEAIVDAWPTSGR
jgi:hypothetical protein